MLCLPIHSLPTNEAERSNTLQKYFTEHIVSSEKNDNFWAIKLIFPDFLDFYVDSNLENGLSWWGSGLTVSDIPLAFRRERKFQLSLNDSWTLFSWSKWLSNHVEKVGFPSEVIILHVDDHDDLMSPRVFHEKSIWKDLITGQELDLLKPDSIKNSIESGAIGIGSFIVPLVHRIPKVHVRHLCATDYSFTRRDLYLLQPILLAEDVIFPDKNRLAVKLINRAENFSETQNTYKVTANLDEWLHDLPSNVPILLHIDMDYFNNRFNGDSDWEIYTNNHDPSGEKLLSSIDLMFNALNQKQVMEKICDISIALSPRFFPSEFWQASVDLIHSHLRN